MQDTLPQLHKKITPIVKKAEKIMLDAFYGETQIFMKGGDHSAVSIVTATDREVDAFLRKELQKVIPGSEFITEEEKNDIPKANYVWIIDPIDGTANFAKKIPCFGLSLGLWYKGKPVYGVLAFPVLGEVIHAMKGHGIFYNGNSFVRPKNKKTENNALFCQAESTEKKLETLKKIQKVIDFPHDYMSASYHFALVALGKFDSVVIVHLPIWDFGASLIIAEEAGLHNAFVTPFPDLKNADVRDYKHSFVMAEKPLAEKIANHLKS